MASPAVFNVDDLAKPFTEGKANGADLRLNTAPDALYQQLRNAYNNSKIIERKLQEGATGADGQPLYTPDQLEWNKVYSLAIKALAEQTKDFQICAWLCEAAVRIHGFVGLRDALKLSRKLAKGFWTGLYPVPEQEEGVEPPTEAEKVQTRIATFEGLLAGALNYAINQVPLTETQPFGFADHRAATELEKITDAAAKQIKINNGAVTMGDFQTAVDGSSPEFYKNLYDDVTACVTELGELAKVLDEKCGKDEKGFGLAPPVGEVEKNLKACAELIKELGKRKGLFQDAAAAGGEQGGAVATVGGAPAGAQNGRQAFTREDAFSQLLVLADFFRRTEPHSPVAYHVEEAVRWGRMSLADLLHELIPDDKMRQQVFTRVGLADVLEAKKK